MRTRPLSLDVSLVPSVLSGLKLNTRRPLTPQPTPNAPDDGGTVWVWNAKRGLHVPYGTVGHLTVHEKGGLRCPLGAPGDGLWLRERARVLDYSDRPGMVRLRYEADGMTRWVEWPARMKPVPVGRCIPNGVHREGSRWSGIIVETRIERIQSITGEDALAEGVRPYWNGGYAFDTNEMDGAALANFRRLWCSLYPGSWERNDWVWVVRWGKPAKVEK